MIRDNAAKKPHCQQVGSNRRGRNDTKTPLSPVRIENSDLASRKTGVIFGRQADGFDMKRDATPI